MGQCKSSVEVVSAYDVDKDIKLNQGTANSYDLAPLVLTCTESTTGTYTHEFEITNKNYKEDLYIDTKDGCRFDEIIEVSLDQEQVQTIPTSPNSIFSSKSFHSPVAFKLCPKTGHLVVTNISTQIYQKEEMKGNNTYFSRQEAPFACPTLSYSVSKDDSTANEGLSFSERNDLLLFESRDFELRDFCARGMESRDDNCSGRENDDMIKRELSADCDQWRKTRNADSETYSFNKKSHSLWQQ